MRDNRKVVFLPCESFHQLAIHSEVALGVRRQDGQQARRVRRRYYAH